jgi:hypothetical protein
MTFRPRNQHLLSIKAQHRPRFHWDCFEVVRLQWCSLAYHLDDRNDILSWELTEDTIFALPTVGPDDDKGVLYRVQAIVSTGWMPLPDGGSSEVFMWSRVLVVCIETCLRNSFRSVPPQLLVFRGASSLRSDTKPISAEKGQDENTPTGCAGWTRVIFFQALMNSQHWKRTFQPVHHREGLLSSSSKCARIVDTKSDHQRPYRQRTNPVNLTKLLVVVIQGSIPRHDPCAFFSLKNQVIRSNSTAVNFFRAFHPPCKSTSELFASWAPGFELKECGSAQCWMVVLSSIVDCSNIVTRQIIVRPKAGSNLPSTNVWLTLHALGPKGASSVQWPTSKRHSATEKTSLLKSSDASFVWGI